VRILAIDHVGFILLSEEVWSDFTHTDTSAIFVGLVVADERMSAKISRQTPE